MLATCADCPNQLVFETFQKEGRVTKEEELEMSRNAKRKEEDKKLTPS